MSEANYYVDTDKAYSVFDPGNGKQKAFILSLDAIRCMEKYWNEYAKKTDMAILPYNPNPNNWIYCDERLPSNSDLVEILVAELDHGEKPEDENAHWHIEIDCGWFDEVNVDDSHRGWNTVNDWDEGQPWAVIAWRQIPRCYMDKYDIRYRDIRWCNAEAK